MTEQNQNAPKIESVSIVAMGRSHAMYIGACAAKGGYKRLAQETWAINSMGGCIEHDRLFLMDDWRDILLPKMAATDAVVAKATATVAAEQERLKLLTDAAEIDAARTKIEEAQQLTQPSMLHGVNDWIGIHPGPVYVPTACPEIPGAVEYPIEEVLSTIQFPYLNTTVAYAIALAIHWKISRIAMYGCDFTYPDVHIAESGRGCAEWLVGIGALRGSAMEIAGGSTLLDSHLTIEQRLYGYAGKLDVQYDEKTSKFTVKRRDTS